MDAVRAAAAYVETSIDDGAVRGIAKLHAQLRGLEGVGRIDIEGLDPNQLNAAASELEDFLDASARLAEEYENAEGSLDQAGDSIEELGEIFGELSEETETAEDSVSDLGKTVDKQPSIFARASKAVKELQGQLKDVGKVSRDVGTGILAASAPILGLAGFAANHFAESSAQINLLAAQTQLGTETIQELGYVAQQSGLDVGMMGEVIGKQTKLIAEAKAGSQDAAVKLQKLGLTVKDVKDLSADEAFALFSDRIASIEDPTKKAAAAMAVWEDGGTKLLPILNLGADGIARMRQEARDLGVVMSSEEVAAGEELSDWMNVISQQSGAAANAIGAALAPSIAELLAWVSPLLTETIQWINENDELIVQIVAVAAGAAAAGSVLVGLGVAASAVATGLGGVLAVGSAVGTVLGGLLSPIGLVAAGIAGLVAYTVDWSEVWDTVTGELGESLGLAADLIANGEIEAAFDLVWAQIQSTWSKGMAWTVENLGGFIVGALGVLSDGIDKIASMVEWVWNKISRLLASAGEFLGILPEGTTDELKQMQEAGQVGESSLHGLATSIQEAADNFSDLGGGVGDAQKRLDELKKRSAALNEEHERERAAGEQQAKEPEKKPKAGGDVPLVAANGGQAGTFSANASRQLYSLQGQSEVVAELKEVRLATNKVEAAVGKKQKVQG